jgi:Kef-type K+ transport system membrane component KefB
MTRPTARISWGLGLALVLPAAGEAAGGSGHAGFGPLLFSLAVLVLAAKIGGLLAERAGQPPVLGELVAGIGLSNLAFLVPGMSAFTAGSADPTLAFLAQVGVLILLFDVGLETDLRALARVGPSAAAVAVIGVVVPIALGGAASLWLRPDQPLLVHLFVGATLSATSVGITARVLKDLGVTREREGQIILGAAILDDVLGLIVLAVVSGMAGAAAAGAGGISSVAVIGIALRAALFLSAAALVGHFLSAPIARLAGRAGHPDETLLVVGLALCFTLAYLAEAIGLADIIGAFAAGVLLDPYGEGIRAREAAPTLSGSLHPLSSLFVPLFFVLMGMQVRLDSLASGAVLGLAAVLLVVAVISKLACGLGVLAPGVNRLAVGLGMLPRGEVGLIFAGIGAGLMLHGQPILSPGLFSAIVLVVLVTTLLAPAGLRAVFARVKAQRDFRQGDQS